MKKQKENLMRMEKVENPVDVCDLLLGYVHNFPLPKEVRARVNLDDLKHSDLDTNHLRLVNKPTCYFGDQTSDSTLPNGVLDVTLDQKRKKDVKSNILFSSVFTNNTTEVQTNHLRTERRTASSCRISLTKAVTKEGSFSLQISPPCAMIQANGGFRREVQMAREREKVFEEELVWSLDTEVVVPPGYRTKADLVIAEDEYDGKFRVETIFEGVVTIRLRDKRDGSVIYTLVVNDLSKALTTEHGFHPVPNQPGAVVFTNEGYCHCHYGISQRVELHQEKL
ncbi:unnamed protein product [Dicrocoelium dendriticum]|nr:unnamed protein product [Dicrocoelium dendriticum]